MITQQIKLNLIPGQVFPRVNASQYDSGTRTLQMALYNGDQVFNIASGMTAFVQGTKPDKTGFQYAATITEGSNIATLDITQQMTAVSGEVVCELVISSGDDRIATVNFILFVEAAALADNTVISETDLPLIEEAVEAVERIGPIAQQVAEDAQTASNAATRAEDAAEAAETWSSNAPYIGANDHWYVYDSTTEQFVDTGVSAEGQTGPQGPQGPTGATGNGIVNITKTSTSGLVDTYTILFTNGTSTTFTITNGQDGQGAGDMTKAVYDPNNAVADAGGIVAYVQAHSGAGTLAGLDDVTLSNLATGQSLVYNATTQKWENAQISYSNLSGKPTLGTAASKNSTNAVAEDSTDLVESGAVYSELALKADSDKAYQTDDTTETTLASDDIIPFYDTSATAKRKMTVQKFGEQLISNPNLLDNPWFTVNQRGQSSYSDVGYAVDRWKISATSMTINVTSNGLEISSNNSSSHFHQTLEEDLVKQLTGKVVTLSIKVMNTTSANWRARLRYVDSGGTFIGQLVIDGLEVGLNNVEGLVPSNTATVTCEIFDNTATEDSTLTVGAIKLELGLISTLAMDTAPNYATELSKCQRYFQVLPKFGRWRVCAFTADVMLAEIGLCTTMRALPSILNNGATLHIRSLDQTTDIVCTNWNIGNLSRSEYSTILLQGFKQAHGLTDGQLNIQTKDLWLSAEI